MTKIDSINLMAPAKINLRLEILGKRDNGYHEIRSIMVPVGLYDSLVLSKNRSEITITSPSSDIPLDHQNLAYKAASMMLKEEKAAGGVVIRLNKSIPIAAGLGGGSSDAAATMQGINALYDFKWSATRLMELGIKIGADVPFFFYNAPAVATGIGEYLTPIKLNPPFWVLLVTPPFPVSTAWAYRLFTAQPSGERITFSTRIDLLEMGHKILYNDLERVVIPHFPEIAEIKKALDDCGAWGALMSGSGPTVFGIFFEEKEAKRAENALVNQYAERNWKIFVARSLL